MADYAETESEHGFQNRKQRDISPLIHKFFEDQPPLVSWGNEESQRQRAFFLAEVAVNPRFLDTLYQETSPIEFPHYYDHFVELFQADPDYFLAFVTYIRGGMNVRTYSAMAKGFLREGAVDRFKAEKGYQPSDGELSGMIQREQGVRVPEEHFGDARRRAKEEDQKVEHMLRGMEKRSGSDN